MIKKIAPLLVVPALLLLAGCSNQLPTRRMARESLLKAKEVMIPSKGIRHTSVDEAKDAEAYYEQQGDPELQAKYIEHLLTITKDHKERGDYMLKVADIYMNLGETEKASKHYAAYRVLYPGSDKIKYVMYQELVANESDALDYLRDQTKTKETLELAQVYLDEFPHDVDHIAGVKEIMQRCYRKLMRNDLSVARYYIRRWSYEDNVKALEAAQRRIENTLKKYTPYLTDGEDLLRLTSSIATSPAVAYADSMTAVIDEIMEKLDILDNEIKPFWKFW